MDARDANADADTSYDLALFKDTCDHFSGEEEEAEDNPDPEELNPELVDPPAEPPTMAHLSSRKECLLPYANILWQER